MATRAAATSPSSSSGRPRVVVVRAGLTGLALASNGLRLARTALLQHPGMDPKSVRWTLVQAAPSVLGEFPQRLAGKARARLHELGVDVRVSAAVAGVTADQANMRPASTAAPSSTHRRLACAVAIVRTEMGDRGLSHGRLAAVGDALHSRRAADRLLHPHRMAGLQGGS
jgi:NADH dehydrogenase FAD-containing subunit